MPTKLEQMLPENELTKEVKPAEISGLISRLCAAKGVTAPDLMQREFSSPFNRRAARLLIVEKGYAAVANLLEKYIPRRLEKYAPTAPKSLAYLRSDWYRYEKFVLTQPQANSFIGGLD